MKNYQVDMGVSERSQKNIERRQKQGDNGSSIAKNKKRWEGAKSKGSERDERDF